jgi:hypothetical protein
MTTVAPAALSEIDAVEFVDLYGLDVKRVNLFMTVAADAPSVRVVGAAAQRIAQLFRTLPGDMQNRCHVPPYGLRFFKDGNLICQASICWKCNNIHGQAGEQVLFYEFDAASPNAQELLAACREALNHGEAEE